MQNYQKYQRQYFVPPQNCTKWMQREYIQSPPAWCSVDLRDGNQALIVPMTLSEKLEFFKFLCFLGFKEIEIGFPASNQTEYDFCRALIEQNLIPDDVSIQVLTQAREHIIKKTFEALEGAKNAIVHLYNSTSAVQRQQVFKKSKKDIIAIAVDGAKLLKRYCEESSSRLQLEYSPESFTSTEMEFALEICNRVLKVWQPSAENKVIINLPVTVSYSMPHIYASQVEYFCENIDSRENVIISLHPHNDRGCAVADSELGLLAGADRIEGTLFGNGERTGNVDLITLALNMYAQGVDPNLDFSDMPKICHMYEELTGMHVYERQPYSGNLVFAAFSGSHQDAIAKGMKWREDQHQEKWNVPYLPIDPTDIGRKYEGDVIRINSQSGKGGIGYVLQKKFGYDLPKIMSEEFGIAVKNESDKKHKELLPNDILSIFTKRYVNIASPMAITHCHFVQQNKGVQAVITAEFQNNKYDLTAIGNGRLDAVSNGIKNTFSKDFSIIKYSEHALEQGSNSQAVAYVGIKYISGKCDEIAWGAGVDEDIMTASINALVSAVNNANMREKI